ncbi:MAG: hypothetical protein RSA57_03795 [Cetobacterium sp.]|uniref:hypothetical protein n=1 Tax=Bacteria TaxID=2 RepID=UPI002FC7E2A4
MEIKVRGLSVDAVSKIDRLAKEKGVSRNEYLKDHLETLSTLDRLSDFESKYTILLERVFKVLEYNTLSLRKFLEFNLIDLEEIVSEEKK